MFQTTNQLQIAGKSCWDRTSLETRVTRVTLLQKTEDESTVMLQQLATTLELGVASTKTPLHTSEVEPLFWLPKSQFLHVFALDIGHLWPLKLLKLTTLLISLLKLTRLPFANVCHS